MNPPSVVPSSQTPAVMLQGTGSDVGKSLLVAGLGRAFTRRGLTVRPFKPQNMSNNAAVTEEGGEIGRAQALQARACQAPLTTDLNPVLLKPQTDTGAQVVVQGRVWGNAQARDYQALRPRLLPAVLESYGRLATQADLVLVEGAGSAAEVNLRGGDIANMGFAVATGIPVVLVGDIDRGGVIASLVGTHALLTGAERALLAGFIVNKFRGDVSLFDDGLKTITKHTGLPSFGIVPWLAEASRLPAEDAVALDRPPASRQSRPGSAVDPIRIAVPVLSRIANFDDLDPLIAEPDVAVDFVPAGRALPGNADVVVLPGTKATLGDLAFLRQQGWDIDIAAHVRRGGLLVGLCGGYQMLGQRIADPQGIEGPPGEATGLGLLDIETELIAGKTLVEAVGWEEASGQAVRGYEMHVGITRGPGLDRPWLRLVDRTGSERAEGAVSSNGRVLGCYLHGLFADDGFRRVFLSRLHDRQTAGLACYDSELEAALDTLANHLESHINLDRLLLAAEGKSGQAA